MSPARAYVIFGALCMALVIVSCSSTSKASLDMTMNQGIVWPGIPEEPRIQYLWSLRQIAGSEGGGLLEYLAGGEDLSKAGSRYSDYLVSPHGLYVGQANKLYVTDTGAGRINVIDLDSMESLTILGDRDFMLATPIGVVADRKGNIYVSDAALRRVVVFSDKGKFKRFLEGTFERPTGLAIDTSAERIYVADTWAHVIHVHAFDGSRLFSVGEAGQGDEKLNYPTHISLDADGNLYVADTLNFRVKIFSPEGDLKKSFGLLGDSYGSFDKIKGIAVDTDGHIYVTDSAQDLVKIFDREGRLLLFFGGKGGFYGRFAHPAGIFIDSTDRVFVADMLNRRVQVFQFLGGG